MPRDPFTGWELDPDPLDATPSEPERRESRRWGCSVALLTLILALSGVPGVVAGERESVARLTLDGSQPRTGEPGRSDQGNPDPPPVTGRIGAIVTSRVLPSDRTEMAWPGQPSDIAVSEPAPSGSVGTAIYTASATWCAPTPDKCQGWGGNARLAAVNSFTWGDEPYPVRVWRGEMYVDVTVVSHCGCFGEDGYIDLSPSAFELLAPLGIGRIDVAVEVFVDLPPHPDDDRMRVEDGGPALPATDTEP